MTIISILGMRPMLIFVLIEFVGCSARSGGDNKYENSRTSQGRITGTWLVKDYIRMVQDTSSPFDSYSALDGISCLFISDLGADTTRIGVRSNNSEGGEIILLRESDTSFLIIDNESEGYSSKSKLKVILAGADTVLRIQYLTGNRINNAKDFERISSTILNEPILDFVNQSLFAGTFSVVDSMDEVVFNRIVLTKVGSISGFGEYLFYEVITDYSVQPEAFDLVVFTKSDLTKLMFAYKISQGDVFLYGLKQQGRDQPLSKKEVIVKENLRYVLRRIR